MCSDCFPRPRFELGLSSRVPQVSAKRAGPSCPIRPRLLDRPSQSSQSWPVNTISIVTIWRMTDHHASAVKASPGRSSRRMRGNVLETSITKRIGVAPVSVEDHSLNSQTGFVLGQPRDFKCVLFHTLPHCAKPMILLARVVACVDDSHAPPHRSRTQLAIALVTQSPCKQILSNAVRPCFLAIVEKPNSRRNQRVVAYTRTQYFRRFGHQWSSKTSGNFSRRTCQTPT